MVEDTVEKSRKPKGTPFHQQKVPGWQPIISTKTLYVPFIIFGIILIISGSLIIYFNFKVQELNIEYTNCKNLNNNMCSDVLTKNNLTYNYQSCTCIMNLTFQESFEGQVYVYYGLTKYYQNHRRYVSSRDDYQLKGLPQSELSENCEPFRYENKTAKIAYAPCGLIANSLFNDTFQLMYMSSNSSTEVPWTNKGIAWKTETSVRFGKPTNWDNTIKPPSWPISAKERDKDSYRDDEELIVWMRTAALPDFRKMHRIVEHNDPLFKSGLPSGDYQLIINYTYPVVSYGGQKFFYLSTVNALGGRNPNLGIFTLTLGTLYIALAIVFIFINTFVARRQMNEIWRVASGLDLNGEARVHHSEESPVHDDDIPHSSTMVPRPEYNLFAYSTPGRSNSAKSNPVFSDPI